MEARAASLLCLQELTQHCLLHVLVQTSPRATHSVIVNINFISLDGCFNTDESNQDLYEKSNVRGIVLSALEGINGTVFMYG